MLNVLYWWRCLKERRKRRRDIKTVRRLKAEAAELRVLLDVERAKSRVLQAEADSLAAVIARDRARTLAETARYARDTIEAEVPSSGRIIA
jgi:hypothetical protein